MRAYPLNKTKMFAEDVQTFFATRTSGIFAKESFQCTCTGADNNITVGLGLGWMALEKYKGLGVYQTDNTETVDLGLADSNLPRIDVVCIQFNADLNVPKVIAKKGSPSSKPTIPLRNTQPNLYELYLCSVYREAGASTIRSSDITDLRLDSKYCGVMADSITEIDTEMLSTQAQDFMAQLAEELQKVKDGSAYLLKTGDKMQGNLNMDNHHIEGLPVPTLSGDPMRKQEFADRVIKSELEANGWYIKVWNNGTFEAWKRGRATAYSDTCNTQWGALFSTKNYPGWVLPSLFPYKIAEPPSCWFSIDQANGDYIIIQGVKGLESTKTHTSGYAFARALPNDQTEYIYMNCYITGKWER